MRKQLVALLLIAALLLQGALAQTAIRPGVFIEVSLLNQDPDPVRPGDTFEVRFKVENTGSTAQQNVALEILPQYPFTVLDSPVREIGTVSAAQVSTEGYTVKYTLQVAGNAASGEYPIDVRYRVGEGWVRVEDFMLSVKSAEVELVLNSITLDPPIVAPGQAANLTLLVENQGAERVRDAKVTLGLSGTELPLAPFGSSNQYTMGDIAPGASRQVSFRLITNPEAAADLYKLPIDLTYKNLEDESFNKSTVTGIRIGSAPDLLAIVDSSDVTQKSGSGTVSIKLVNKGLTDLGFVVVRLAQGDAFDVLSSQEVYLGKLESDDFETADFQVQVNERSEGAVTLPLIVQFRDSTNQEFEQTIPVTVRLLSDAQAQQLGITQGGSWLGIIIVVLIAGAAIWWFFLRKKKRK